MRNSIAFLAEFAEGLGLVKGMLGGNGWGKLHGRSTRMIEACICNFS